MVPGDRISSKISDNQFNQTIQYNPSTEFRWYGLVTGTHSFSFTESKVTPDGTTFMQREDFSGILAWYMKPGMLGGKDTTKGFLS